MSNKMYDNITGRSPIATDDLGYIGTGQKASQILSGGTTDYDALTNKPSINSVELSGNKTSSDLGLQPELTEAQTNAVNSGITAALTEQINTNKNNISTFHKEVNTDIYYQETAPTGSITDGSYWVSTKGNYRYNKSSQLFDDSTDIKSAYLRQIDGVYLDSGSGSLSAVVAISGYKTIEISCNSKTLRIGYFSELPTNNANAIKYVNTEYFTYEQHTIAPLVPDNATYIVVNCYLSTVEQVDGKTQSDIFDTLTIYGTWQ